MICLTKSQNNGQYGHVILVVTKYPASWEGDPVISDALEVNFPHFEAAASR